MEFPLLALILVLALRYANGMNDVSKAMATLVGSGVTNYRRAILWGTIWTMAGASASAFVVEATISCPDMLAKELQLSISPKMDGR
jgi:PiT family inorganic phosphate transporter